MDVPRSDHAAAALALLAVHVGGGATPYMQSARVFGGVASPTRIPECLHLEGV